MIHYIILNIQRGDLRATHGGPGINSINGLYNIIQFTIIYHTMIIIISIMIVVNVAMRRGDLRASHGGPGITNTVVT